MKKCEFRELRKVEFFFWIKVLVLKKVGECFGRVGCLILGWGISFIIYFDYL